MISGSSGPPSAFCLPVVDRILQCHVSLLSRLIEYETAVVDRHRHGQRMTKCFGRNLLLTITALATDDRIQFQILTAGTSVQHPLRRYRSCDVGVHQER